MARDEERVRRRRRRTEEPEAVDQQEEVEQAFDFEADLEIDRDLLDEEFLHHPRVFMKWAKLSAEAVRDACLAEEHLKTVRSELVLDVTKDPEECLDKGLKAVATTIEAYYRTHPKYIAAKEAMLEAQYTSNLLLNAVSAFHARKMSLERLVVLHGQEYYSTPQVPRDDPSIVERVEAIRQKSTRSRISGTLNK